MKTATKQDLKVGRGYGWTLDSKCVLEFRGFGYDRFAGVETYKFKQRFYHGQVLNSEFSSLEYVTLIGA